MVFLNSPDLLFVLWLTAAPIVFLETWASVRKLNFWLDACRNSAPNFLNHTQSLWLRFGGMLQVGLTIIPLVYALALLLIFFRNAVAMGSDHLNLSYAVFLAFSVLCIINWLGCLIITNQIKKRLHFTSLPKSFLVEIKSASKRFVRISSVNVAQYLWLLILVPFSVSSLSPDGRYDAQLIMWPSLERGRHLAVSPNNFSWTAHWHVIGTDNPCSSLVWSVNSEVVFCRGADKYVSAYSVKTGDYFVKSLFLDYAYMLDAPPGIASDRAGKIAYYIQQGASVPNMLFTALDDKNIDATKALLGFVKNINAIHAHNIYAAYDGTTLLGKALDNMQSEPEKSAQLVKLLLDAGADPNQPVTDQFQYHPLEQAVQDGNFLIIKTLVEAGAIVTIDDNSPIGRAYGPDKQKIIDYLVQHGADINKADRLLKTTDTQGE